MIGWDPRSKKRVNYYIEGKGVGNDVNFSAQNVFKISPLKKKKDNWSAKISDLRA